MPADALSDLSLRQLLSFRAVADEGSFHGAADALDYTQSAVSQHVMALEAALGVRLFDRGPRPADRGAHRGRRACCCATSSRSPTASRPRARTCSRTRPARPARSGSACTRASARACCPRSSAASREAWPNVEIRLTEANSDQGLFELLGPGALDLSFGVLPLQEGPFEAVELLQDPFVLVAAADSPLAGRSTACRRSS